MMINAREVLAYEKIDIDLLSIQSLKELVVELATLREHAGLQKVEIYNRLASVIIRVERTLFDYGNEGLEVIKELVHHPDPGVFEVAILNYFRHIDADEAKFIAQTLCDTNGVSKGLQKKARDTLSSWKFHAKYPTTIPPDEPARTPPVREHHYVHLDRAGLARLATERELLCVVPLLPQLAWPSIRVVRTPVPQADIALGSSRLGGIPDMPSTLEWPRYEDNPMSLIAQIALADLVPYRDFTHLPAAGHLLFFYDTFEQPWDREEGKPNTCAVFFIEPDALLERRRPPDDLFENLVYRASNLQFYEEASLAGWMPEDPAERFDKISEEVYLESEALEEAARELKDTDNAPKHKLFGFPDELQGSMYLDWEASEETPSEDERWRLLLQIDSEDEHTPGGNPGMFWGSGGLIYFWIKRSDLYLGRFGDVSLILQCT